MTDEMPTNPTLNPFENLSALRLDQSYADTVGVKKLLTTVPVRRPNRQDFVRVHPDPNFRLTPAAIIEMKEDREVYLVTPNMAEANLLEFPNLRIELAAVSAESCRAWFRSFVIDGNSSAANEKTGTLSFLSPNLAAMLATIRFHNLGIFRLENAPADTSGEVMRVVAELYCERMELAIGSPAHASSNWGRN
jgi:hypothetical protein